MKAVLVLLAVSAAIVAAVGLTAALVFDSEDNGRFDVPRPVSTGMPITESAAHRAAARAIADGLATGPPAAGAALLQMMREQMDDRGEAASIMSRVRGVDAGGVPAEWVIARGADPRRRVLYIHGGGYAMGSAKSHRRITSRFSEISGSSVLAINYRLMPENPRMAGIEDCRTAYRWLLGNGPDGPSAPRALIIAGDSAGGNLALVTAAWARDEGIRAADAVVALSPPTDATLSSPSLVSNMPSDVMQRGGLGPAVTAPKVFSLWASFLINRINPRSPLVSPLLGDLSHLPPTLLQASEAEMFLDDAIRYANKAAVQGSIAVVQTWPYAMHVWHAFDVPEADEAFAEIEKFLARYAPRTPEETLGRRAHENPLS